ncbi:bifunctional N-acetylglucosamine-1-phosphate uridyltransferase [Gluconacetobacter johannae DSM 13595]|uniref:Bifunctional protein GlmU n=1 Tax=Gluconacetobacter johannae TaxID=112140 RepID=A0A7W4P376_9PROT|nr:bifunctional UDP-N-acetylglucosamine diphosphorylase/glucosamine-1-phosphate N-acetyltransferase GlmU [Gluconacetobacter johannae]MBB2175752.1 bifunctional UDP-N-acetylglucosamine diphosphorylase/glucosamine-1-phosphate N-acetyltransferase GlmU [Gluconacetobacter johannae]GBQ82998.1 bifunctional N-acetylglucosamine-1-phosphate uridyltransferase [Gluconacetobacter johannae DSM 13595]
MNAAAESAPLGGTTAHRPATAVILAAGLGTRMKSDRPKVMHPLAGRPMLRYLLDNAASVFDRIVVVVGPGMEQVASLAAPHAVVVQQDRLGTAHAALQAAGLFGDGDVAVLYGDNPLITADTMRRLLACRAEDGVGLALLAMRPRDPGRYGRVVTEGGLVRRIVEWADATPQERAIDLCNAGVLCAGADAFGAWLRAVGNDNAKGEYYLGDVVAQAVADGRQVRAVEAAEDELRGINSRAELAEAEACVQGRLRAAVLDAGATLVAPETVFLSADTVLEPDVTVQPHVVFGPGVTVRRGAEIRAFSHLEGCVVGPGAQIGPYARLRPGSDVGPDAHVGNFVELKAVTMGAGAKANHLTYLGDATIGAGTNIGAGTISCNYDGVFKHRTTIGEGCFIGSDAILVAPVTIGDGALVAAGSVITEDVPPEALALGRARQTNKDGRGAAMRAALRKKKEQG